MKRILAVLAVLGCAAMIAGADTNEVTSVNIVGYNKVDIPADSFVMLGMQFDAFDPTFMGVFGTNTLNDGGGDPASADVLWVWKTGDLKYKSYFQGPAMPGVAPKQFYDLETFTATNPALEAGQAMWIQSPAGNSNEIVFAGEVVESPEIGTPVVEGWQQLAYPFSADTTIGELDFNNDGGTQAGDPTMADNIWVWDPSVPKYTQYFLTPFGTWYNAETFQEASNDTLPMGTGFWYVSQTNFVWTQTNAYIDNL